MNKLKEHNQEIPKLEKQRESSQWRLFIKIVADDNSVDYFQNVIKEFPQL